MLIEYIGFIITLLAMTAMFWVRKREERRRLEDPEAYTEEQEEKERAYIELLRSVNPDLDLPELPKKIPPPLPPTPKVKKQEEKIQPVGIHHFDQRGTPHFDEAKLEVAAFAEGKRILPSRAQTYIARLKSPRDLWVYQAILSPPRDDF